MMFRVATIHYCYNPALFKTMYDAIAALEREGDKNFESLGIAIDAQGTNLGDLIAVPAKHIERFQKLTKVRAKDEKGISTQLKEALEASKDVVRAALGPEIREVRQRQLLLPMGQQDQC